MKKILIRDDDVNFFTDPQMLETVYGFLFERDIAVNFSVIPAVNSSAKTESIHFGPGSPEPFLPRDVSGKNETHPITGNPELLSYLKSLRRKEFLLHGYEHAGKGGNYEFESNNRAALLEKLHSGISEFQAALGVSPKTFVAPQDKYSLAAFSEIRSRFRTFSLGWVERNRIPRQLWSRYVQMKLLKRNYLWDNSLLILEHPGCLFSKFANLEQSVTRLRSYVENHELTVLVTHHWEFFDEGVLNVPLLNAFRETVLDLQKTSEFLTFSEWRARAV